MAQKAILDNKALENINLSEYLPLSGGTMNGPIQFPDTTALPQFSGSIPYYVGIEAYANGGTLKWQSADECWIERAKRDYNGNIITSTYSNVNNTHNGKIYELSDGSKWILVFYHNTRGRNIFFNSINECLCCDGPYKYSRLISCDQYKGSDDKIEFLLRYPLVSSTKYNRWKQSYKPQDEFIPSTGSGGVVTGYEAIHIDSSSNYWGGLCLNNSSGTLGECYIDGSVGHSNWYYAIGTNSKYVNGFPAAAGFGSDSTTEVELYCRLN